MLRRYAKTLRALLLDRTELDPPIASRTIGTDLVPPYWFLLGSVAAAILLVRLATLPDPFGDPGWPLPLLPFGTVTLMFVILFTIVGIPTFVIQALLVSMSGRRLPVAAAARATAYMFALTVLATAVVLLFMMQMGGADLGRPRGMWLFYLIGFLTQLAIIWLVARRLRRLFGARTWLTILLVYSSWFIGVGLPFEILRGSVPLRVALWNFASESMLPTIRQGDVVASDRWAFIFDKPQRGDLVAFKVEGRDVVFLHRVVGVPGDRIQYRNGRLWLNGAEVPWSDKGEFSFSDDRRRDTGARVIEERLDERTFQTLDLVRNADTDDTREFVVPANHVFFLGDNRDNALDSRIDVRRRGYGMVPFEALIGRVYHRVGPDPGPLK